MKIEIPDLDTKVYRNSDEVGYETGRHEDGSPKFKPEGQSSSFWDFIQWLNEAWSCS
jgi:hypothetical protein